MYKETWLIYWYRKHYWGNLYPCYNLGGRAVDYITWFVYFDFFFWPGRAFKNISITRLHHKKYNFGFIRDYHSAIK